MKQKKLLLRKKINKHICKLSEDLFDKSGKLISEILMPWLLKKKIILGSNIAFFSSITGEINTRYLDQILLKNNFNRFLPKITKHEMHFYELKKTDTILNLNKGKYNIPIPEGNTWVDINKLSIIFVPGVAFDKFGNRLGRGKGFYDRLLQHVTPGKKKPLLVGLALDEQIAQYVPVDNLDVPMDYICTPKLGLLKTNRDLNE